MDISSVSAPPYRAAYDAAASVRTAGQRLQSQDDAEESKLREAFQDFVGQTFYGQMLSSMRKTVGKPAYFYGGRTEEVFQTQLDQVLAEKLSDATADTFAEPMYQLFSLSRR
jgi:peptidoglycan hydrolase FlgJ